MNQKALYRDFLDSTVDNIVQKHAPIKKRYVRANQASFVNSKIHKEVIRMTRLRNKFIESIANTL